MTVYFGSAGGVDSSPAWSTEGGNAERLGDSVSAAGDVNGDGYGDLVVGAYLYNSGYCGEDGAAFIFLGSAIGLASGAAWTGRPEQCNAYYGQSVAGAGDVNGDGYADVLVGAPRYDYTSGDAGRAFLYYGNGSAGPSLTPQQRRADDSAPIAPLGWSDSKTGFRLAMLGRTPFGAGHVRLQWEVEPAGTLFDGLGLGESPTWQPVASTPASFNELVSGLAESQAYHWRMRLLYDPATTPFQPRSRWISGSWNGPQEADLALPRSASLSLSMVDTPDPYVINFDTAGITYTLSIGQRRTRPGERLGGRHAPRGRHVRLGDTQPGKLLAGRGCGDLQPRRPAAGRHARASRSSSPRTRPGPSSTLRS